jgi:peptidoglycan/LPS O-acetylase OafA/YrhL
MALRSWRDRLWLGLAVFIGVSVVMLIGPAYLRPLPMWAKLVILVAGCGFIAAVAVYSRRRARHANSPAPRA